MQTNIRFKWIELFTKEKEGQEETEWNLGAEKWLI